MYKSTYLAVRIHTEDEALRITPEGDTDTLLWLIDVYDLGESEKCAEAVKRLILSKYFELQDRVPGMLPRWTKGMMAWVTYLNALVPCYEYDEEWVIANNLLIARNAETWSLRELLITLDAVAMRWKNACYLDRTKLEQYLHCMWSCAKKYTMYLHDELPQGLKEGTKFKIRPRHIMACFSRFFWFHKTLAMYDTYAERHVCETQSCEAFFNQELRHFVLRKFRDQLLTDTWESLPFYGDTEIAGHEQLGDKMSTYSVLYKRQPVCLLQRVQQVVLYDEPEEVRKRHQNVTDIKIIQTYFQNNFKVDFKKFFMCSERNHPKHEAAVKISTIPVIVESFKKYMVVLNGKAYGNGTVADVFLIWVALADKPHGLDISDLKQALTAKEKTQRRLGTIYELSVF